jgi:hypothetical protein
MEGRRIRRAEDEPRTESSDRRHVDERQPRRAVVDRERQRGKYGGFNFGAAFYAVIPRGWERALLAVQRARGS